MYGLCYAPLVFIFCDTIFYMENCVLILAICICDDVASIRKLGYFVIFNFIIYFSFEFFRDICSRRDNQESGCVI